MKTYVIDTNVLVHDYHAFDNILNGNKVVIPYQVLQELDNLKSKTNAVGVNARHAIRRIEAELIAETENLLVDMESYPNIKEPDDKILELCLCLASPILISKDVCLRTKARVKGVQVEDYREDKVQVSDLYSGLATEYVTSEDLDTVYKVGKCNAAEGYYPNQAVVLIDYLNQKNKCLTIHKSGTLYAIDNKMQPFGLTPANMEQHLAVNLLLDKDIPLMSMTGRSGSGKTLLAVACALEAVLERNEYSKITIARPVMPFQNDIGYLPGDLRDKLTPWLMPIVDNLEYLFSFSEQTGSKRQGKVSKLEELMNFGVIEIAPLTFIRGRSIPNQFIIIDEAQQVTKEEMKTILTRAGTDSKVVLTGDYNQIDNPYLSADNNGLVYCVDKFKEEEIAAHIGFTKCERSKLAEVADRIM